MQIPAPQPLLALTLIACLSVRADNLSLPPVSYPAENPPTEAKRILGKILFWDEQLSTDNSIACGSCHKPSASGSDNIRARKAGYDQKLGSKDDIFGSFGVIKRDTNGSPLSGKGLRQITDRASQNFFGGLWASSNFWDGRASSQFIDPQTNQVVIHKGGALESQSLGPLMSDVEMAKQNQTIDEVITKLSQAKPLALASDYPLDIKQLLSNQLSYPKLFADAFGDEVISFSRIAFAIATYERSLIADQTPWDLAQENEKPLTYQQNLGWQFFKNSGCEQCHKPPLFTDNKFHNIGIQGQNADAGHKQVSGNSKDVGKMKTPTLRNIGLKSSFMHTGEFSRLSEVIDAYAEAPFKSIASQMPNGEDYNFTFTEQQRRHLITFLEESLTDPRVANEQFPFDRPTLRSELQNKLITGPQKLNVTGSLSENNAIKIEWGINTEINGVDIEIERNDGIYYWSAQSPFYDKNTERGQQYRYRIKLRDAKLNPITEAHISITTSGLPPAIMLLLAIMGILISSMMIRHFCNKRYN